MICDKMPKYYLSGITYTGFTANPVFLVLKLIKVSIKSMNIPERMQIVSRIFKLHHKK